MFSQQHIPLLWMSSLKYKQNMVPHCGVTVKESTI